MLFLFPSLIIIFPLIFIINCPQCIVFARYQITENMEAVLNRLRDSVDRFDAHFQRAFDEYGRVESVREILDDRVVPHFILEQHSRVNFITASRQLQQRVQRVFDTKMRALRRLVRAAEKAAQKVDVDTELGPTLRSELHCRAQMRALNASLVHNSHIWRKSGGRPKSGVHVALEMYKCSGLVKRDFDWTGQALIEQAMAENAQDDAALVRQYIGTYSGLTRMFPGFYWNVGPEQFSMDLFDPRFRPWFTAAESAPRDVLFLLDFSGSAKGLNVHLIKTSVMAVLQTLTPNDFFSGIWYNSRRELVLTNCTKPRGDTFVPATSRNKLLFRRFLDRLEERDQAVLPPAMEASFAQFMHAHQQNSSMEAARPLRSGGHRLVLLFTDGIEFWPTDVVQRYQQHEKAHGSPPIRVFGHSIGHGRGVQSALTWLTCQTKAGLAQAEIGSVAEIRLKARAYLAKLSEVLALAYRERAADPERRPISWTNPYMDVQRGGAVLSLSMPLLGPQSAIYRDLNLSREHLMERSSHAKLDGFIGVAGLDIGFAELARVMALEGEDGTLAYAFLVDNNGLVYFHPRLSTRPAELFAFRRTLCHRISTTLLRSNIRVPFSKADELVHQQLGYVDSVPHRDLLELEPDSPLMRQFRTRLVQRQCGTGEAPLEDAQRQLRCVPLRDTPLVIGMVLIKERARVSASKQHFQNGREGVQEDEEDPFELAERFRSAGFPTEADEPNEETANRRQFSPQNGNGSFAHQQSVGILLTPGPIEQWELSTALSSARPLSRFRALIRLLPSVRRADPFLAHLSALAPDSVFPLWAASWNSTVSSVTSMRRPSSSVSGSCAPRPLPPRIEPRLFRSAFLQIRASSLRDRAALTAFFPRCEFKSVNGIVQRTKPPPELADDDDETSNGKLRIEVDLVDGGSADTILSVQKSVAFVGNSIPLVQIGVQLRGHFFQLKFQRALQQQQGSWQECAKAGRKCLLISDDSVLLASSDPGFMLDAGVVHLSSAEPELFSELLSRGFIRKVVWRDINAQCPMVITLDPRQLQRQQYLQQHMHPSLHSSASTVPDSSAASSLSAMRIASTMLYLLRQLLSLLPATFQWLVSSFLWLLPGGTSAADSAPLFAPLESIDCQIDDHQQPTEMLEQCTVEHTRYRLRGRAKERKYGSGSGGRGGDESAVWMKDRLCNRTIGLLPFARSQLFLLLIDGQCDKTAETTNASGKVAGDIKGSAKPLFPQFVAQKQVPNCDLTRSSLELERTLRPDLDYTLSHPKEFNPICTISSKQHQSQFSALWLLFSLIASICALFFLTTNSSNHFA